MNLDFLPPVGASLLWACALTAFRRVGPQCPAFTVNVLKNLVTLAVALPFIPGCGAALAALSRDEWILLCANGILNVNAYALVFWSNQLLGAGRESILHTLNLVFVAILSVAFLGQSVHLSTVLGMLLVLGGGAVVAARQQSSVSYKADPKGFRKGVMASVLASLVIAVGTVAFVPVAGRIPAHAAAGLRVVAGMGPVWIWLLFSGRWRGEVATVRRCTAPWILAFGSACAAASAFLWVVSMRHGKTTETVVLLQTTPFFALVLGALFVGERLSWRKGLGGFLVFLGAWVISDPAAAAWMNRLG